MNSIDSSAHPVKVMVVETDRSLLDLVARFLVGQGFAVEAVACGEEALKGAGCWRPHLIVLAVVLPDMRALELARCLASDTGCPPILFLGDDASRAAGRGLTVAGNDWLTKPFSLEELIARLRGLLRRNGLASDYAGGLVVGDLELDEEGCEVCRGGRAIALSATEFRLLRYFMRYPGRVISRRELVDHVWSYDFRGDTRVLDTYIGYLRRKVDDGTIPLLHTVRHRGYRLGLPASASARSSRLASNLVGSVR